MRRPLILVALVAIVIAGNFVFLQDNSQGDRNSPGTSNSSQIELLRTPSPGQSNTIQVNKEKVSGKEVLLNGEKVAELNDAGIASFTVPNTSEITVKVDGLQKTVETVRNRRDSTKIRNGFSFREKPVAGKYNTLTLFKDNKPVSEKTVYIGGSKIGTTNQYGEIRLKIPEKRQITVSTKSEQRKFQVKGAKPSSTIRIEKPEKNTVIEASSKEDVEVRFEATVKTESPGKAKITLNGEKIRQKKTFKGSNHIEASKQVGLGKHTWSLTIENPQNKTTSRTRNFEIKHSEAREGISLKYNASANEHNYMTLYKNGKPIKGEEVYINGNKVGKTNKKGETGFNVPNKPKINVSTENYQQTFTVENYTENKTPLAHSINIVSPQTGVEIQKPFYFNATVDAGIADSYEIRNNNQVLASGNLKENSTNKLSKRVSPKTGKNTLELIVKNSENRNRISDSVKVDIWKIIQITNPSTGDSFDSNEVNFEFTLSKPLNGSYHILVDGVQRYSSSLGSSTGYQKTLLVEDRGIHTATVQIDSDKKTYSDTLEFSVKQSSQTSVELLKPSDGALVQTPALKWKADHPLSYWTYLIVDGKKLVSRSKQGREDKIAAEISDSISYGEHTWRAYVKDEATSQEEVSSQTRSFEYVGIDRKSPQDLTAVSSPVQFKFDIKTGKGNEALLYINGSQKKKSELKSGSNTFRYSTSLSPNQYEYTLKVRDTNTGKSTKTSRLFEVK